MNCEFRECRVLLHRLTADNVNQSSQLYSVDKSTKKCNKKKQNITDHRNKVSYRIFESPPLSNSEVLPSKSENVMSNYRTLTPNAKSATLNSKGGMSLFKTLTPNFKNVISSYEALSNSKNVISSCKTLSNSKIVMSSCKTPSNSNNVISSCKTTASTFKNTKSSSKMVSSSKTSSNYKTLAKISTNAVSCSVTSLPSTKVICSFSKTHVSPNFRTVDCNKTVAKLKFSPYTHEKNRLLKSNPSLPDRTPNLVEKKVKKKKYEIENNHSVTKSKHQSKDCTGFVERTHTENPHLIIRHGSGEKFSKYFSQNSIPSELDDGKIPSSMHSPKTLRVENSTSNEKSLKSDRNSLLSHNSSSLSNDKSQLSSFDGKVKNTSKRKRKRDEKTSGATKSVHQPIEKCGTSSSSLTNDKFQSSSLKRKPKRDIEKTSGISKSVHHSVEEPKKPAKRLLSKDHSVSDPQNLNDKFQSSSLGEKTKKAPKIKMKHKHDTDKTSGISQSVHQSVEESRKPIKRLHSEGHHHSRISSSLTYNKVQSSSLGEKTKKTSNIKMKHKHNIKNTSGVSQIVPQPVEESRKPVKRLHSEGHHHSRISSSLTHNKFQSSSLGKKTKKTSNIKSKHEHVVEKTFGVSKRAHERCRKSVKRPRIDGHPLITEEMSDCCQDSSSKPLLQNRSFSELDSKGHIPKSTLSAKIESYQSISKSRVSNKMPSFGESISYNTTLGTNKKSKETIKKKRKHAHDIKENSIFPKSVHQSIEKCEMSVKQSQIEKDFLNTEGNIDCDNKSSKPLLQNIVTFGLDGSKNFASTTSPKDLQNENSLSNHKSTVLVGTLNLNHNSNSLPDKKLGINEKTRKTIKKKKDKHDIEKIRNTPNSADQTVEECGRHSKISQIEKQNLAAERQSESVKSKSSHYLPQIPSGSGYNDRTVLPMDSLQQQKQSKVLDNKTSVTDRTLKKNQNSSEISRVNSKAILCNVDCVQGNILPVAHENKLKMLNPNTEAKIVLEKRKLECKIDENPGNPENSQQSAKICEKSVKSPSSKENLSTERVNVDSDKKSSKPIFESTNSTGLDHNYVSSTHSLKSIENSPSKRKSSVTDSSSIPNGAFTEAAKVISKSTSNASNDILSGIIKDMNELHGNVPISPVISARPFIHCSKSKPLPVRTVRRFNEAIEDKRKLSKTNVDTEVSILLHSMINTVATQMEQEMQWEKFRKKCRFCHTEFFTNIEIEIACVICYDLGKVKRKFTEKRLENKLTRKNNAMSHMKKKLNKSEMLRFNYAKRTSQNSTEKEKGYYHCKNVKDHNDSSKINSRNTKEVLSKEVPLERDEKQKTKSQLEIESTNDPLKNNSHSIEKLFSKETTGKQHAKKQLEKDCSQNVKDNEDCIKINSLNSEVVLSKEITLEMNEKQQAEKQLERGTDLKNYVTSQRQDESNSYATHLVESQTSEFNTLMTNNELVEIKMDTLPENSLVTTNEQCSTFIFPPVTTAVSSNYYVINNSFNIPISYIQNAYNNTSINNFGILTNASLPRVSTNLFGASVLNMSYLDGASSNSYQNFSAASTYNLLGNIPIITEVEEHGESTRYSSDVLQSKAAVTSSCTSASIPIITAVESLSRERLSELWQSGAVAELRSCGVQQDASRETLSPISDAVCEKSDIKISEILSGTEVNHAFFSIASEAVSEPPASKCENTVVEKEEIPNLCEIFSDISSSSENNSTECAEETTEGKATVVTGQFNEVISVMSKDDVDSKSYKYNKNEEMCLRNFDCYNSESHFTQASKLCFESTMNTKFNGMPSENENHIEQHSDIPKPDRISPQEIHLNYNSAVCFEIQSKQVKSILSNLVEKISEVSDLSKGTTECISSECNASEKKDVTCEKIRLSESTSELSQDFLTLKKSQVNKEIRKKESCSTALVSSEIICGNVLVEKELEFTKLGKISSPVIGSNSDNNSNECTEASALAEGIIFNPTENTEKVSDMSISGNSNSKPNKYDRFDENGSESENLMTDSSYANSENKSRYDLRKDENRDGCQSYNSSILKQQFSSNTDFDHLKVQLMLDAIALLAKSDLTQRFELLERREELRNLIKTGMSNRIQDPTKRKKIQALMYTLVILDTADTLLKTHGTFENVSNYFLEETRKRIDILSTKANERLCLFPSLSQSNGEAGSSGMTETTSLVANKEVDSVAFKLDKEAAYASAHHIEKNQSQINATSDTNLPHYDPVSDNNDDVFTFPRVLQITPLPPAVSEPTILRNDKNIANECFRTPSNSPSQPQNQALLPVKMKQVETVCASSLHSQINVVTPNTSTVNTSNNFSTNAQIHHTVDQSYRTPSNDQTNLHLIPQHQEYNHLSVPSTVNNSVAYPPACVTGSIPFSPRIDSVGNVANRNSNNDVNSQSEDQVQHLINHPYQTSYNLPHSHMFAQHSQYHPHISVQGTVRPHDATTVSAAAPPWNNSVGSVTCKTLCSSFSQSEKQANVSRNNLYHTSPTNETNPHLHGLYGLLPQQPQCNSVAVQNTVNNSIAYPPNIALSTPSRNGISVGSEVTNTPSSVASQSQEQIKIKKEQQETTCSPVAQCSFVQNVTPLAISNLPNVTTEMTHFSSVQDCGSSAITPHVSVNNANYQLLTSQRNLPFGNNSVGSRTTGVTSSSKEQFQIVKGQQETTSSPVAQGSFSQNGAAPAIISHSNVTPEMLPFNSSQHCGFGTTTQQVSVNSTNNQELANQRNLSPGNNSVGSGTCSIPSQSEEQVKVKTEQQETTSSPVAQFSSAQSATSPVISSQSHVTPEMFPFDKSQYCSSSATAQHANNQINQRNLHLQEMTPILPGLPRSDEYWLPPRHQVRHRTDIYGLYPPYSSISDGMVTSDSFQAPQSVPPSNMSNQPFCSPNFQVRQDAPPSNMSNRPFYSPNFQVQQNSLPSNIANQPLYSSQPQFHPANCTSSHVSGLPSYNFPSSASTPGKQHACSSCGKIVPVNIRCKKCFRVYYCSDECAKFHWYAGHHKECNVSAS